jgi:hypothetical protein
MWKPNNTWRNRRISLIPWNRGILEKLTIAQIDKKFFAYYGT